MTAVAADTQAIVWWIVSPDRLSSESQAAFALAQSSGSDIFISAISLIELRYLVEKGRVEREVLDGVVAVVTGEASPVTVVPVDLELALVIDKVPRDAVPDMPDRIVGATAVKLGVPLITSDRDLRNSSVPTIWRSTDSGPNESA